MGRGVRPGRILFEMEGVDRATALEAMRLASHKLPVKTIFVEREAGGLWSLANRGRWRVRDLRVKEREAREEIFRLRLKLRTNQLDKPARLIRRATRLRES